MEGGPLAPTRPLVQLGGALPRSLNVRLLTPLLCAATLVSTGLASPASDLRARARAAEARFDPRGALTLYLQLDALEPGQADVAQKIARQYSDLAELTTNAEARRDELERGLAYAVKADQLQPNNAVNVLSLAICHGKLAACSDVRTKIAYSRLVKDEAERALALDPTYAWADHILGCWHYEVASLTGVERLVARMFYGGLPPASYAESIRYLKRAVELEPNDPAHVIELGFAYRAAGDREAARAEFEKGLALTGHENFDAEAQRRARSALADL